MLKSPAKTSAILKLDYQMKYEPKTYRQRSSDWYGRKCISRNGSVVTYRAHNTERERQNRTDREMEEDLLTDVKHKFYDHICANTSEKSTFAVLSIIKMLAHNIFIENPTIKELVMRTDNTANYHYRELPSFPVHFQGIWY